MQLTRKNSWEADFQARSRLRGHLRLDSLAAPSTLFPSYSCMDNKIVVMRSHSKIQQHWEKDMDRVGVRDLQDDIAVSGGETLFSKYEITDYTD
eukprot:259564-Hanusia_phi.AAC.1